MIEEKEYLEAKKIVKEYESKQLNISDVSLQIEQCEHEYSDGCTTGWYVCKKCGDIY